MSGKAHQEADQVLLSFRKRRSTPACYPCSQRKVKCRGGRPCDACRARGHPNICEDDDTRKRRRTATTNLSSNRDVATVSPHEGLQKTNHTSSTNSAESSVRSSVAIAATEPTVGSFSAINFVRERLGRTQGSLNRDIHPSIGLGNTVRRPPLVAPLHVSPREHLTTPAREEIVQFFPSFRDIITTLYPFVYDMVALETRLHQILQANSRVEPQHIAVVLAALALGAQFTELVNRPRREIAHDFVNRANAYLQDANYIFQPSLEVVQALLMIGMSLQNCGQSDGAWALLGLNYRLAQTLNLHTLQPADGPGGMLWTSLIWQDALISLRYDRPPLSYSLSVANVDAGPNLSYFDAMRACCLVSISLLQRSPAQRVDVEYIFDSIRVLDNALARCAPHLQPRNDRPRTLAQRLQCLALKLHSSLVLAEVCRPVFSIGGVEESHRMIRQRGFNALIANIEAFLEICTFSNVPLRLWSMTQAAISCALVLALLDTPGGTLPFRSLLTRLLHALKMDSGAHDPVTSMSMKQLEGVCLLRIKAAGLLESILSHAHSDSSSSYMHVSASASTMAVDSTAVPLEKCAVAEDLTWPTDLSLFDRAFADSIMDFEVNPEWFNSINWHD